MISAERPVVIHIKGSNIDEHMNIWCYTRLAYIKPGRKKYTQFVYAKLGMFLLKEMYYNADKGGRK